MLLQVVKLKRGFAVCASEQLMDSLGQRCFFTKPQYRTVLDKLALCVNPKTHKFI